MTLLLGTPPERVKYTNSQKYIVFPIPTMNKNNRTKIVQTFSAIGQTDEDIRRLLQDLNAGKGSFKKMGWRDIGQLPVLNQINYGTLNRYARGDKIIDPLHRIIFGLSALVETEPCPTCGAAHNYDCGHKRVVTKPGKSKRKRTRFEISPGTPADKIIEEVFRVTGIRLMEDKVKDVR